MFSWKRTARPGGARWNPGLGRMKRRSWWKALQPRDHRHSEDVHLYAEPFQTRAREAHGVKRLGGFARSLAPPGWESQGKGAVPEVSSAHPAVTGDWRRLFRSWVDESRKHPVHFREISMNGKRTYTYQPMGRSCFRPLGIGVSWACGGNARLLHRTKT